MNLTLGYAQQTITPALSRPVYLAGFGQNRLAAGVHDDLTVRALALEQNSTVLALAVLDLIGLSRAHCREIERRVSGHRTLDRVIIACTHTHHGPDPIGLWGPDETTSGVDEAWLSIVKEKAVATILDALNHLQRVDTQKTFACLAPGLAKNARDPAILDDELAGLQFCSAGGQPIVTLLIFPCHPEVLWEHNLQITADYVNSLRRDVEAATGAPCMFFAGDLGGMLTPDVKDHSFEEAEAMGASLAQAALTALGPASAETVGRLGIRSIEFEIPMRSPLFELAIQVGLFKDNRTPAGAVQTEASLIKIGPAWLAAVPGEILPKLGLAIKARLREAGAGISAIIGLANDELGYILPLDDYVYPEDPFDPGEHYEETMSIGPDAGPGLMTAMDELIAGL